MNVQNVRSSLGLFKNMEMKDTSLFTVIGIVSNDENNINEYCNLLLDERIIHIGKEDEDDDDDIIYISNNIHQDSNTIHIVILKDHSKIFLICNNPPYDEKTWKWIYTMSSILLIETSYIDILWTILPHLRTTSFTALHDKTHDKNTSNASRNKQNRNKIHQIPWLGLMVSSSSSSLDSTTMVSTVISKALRSYNVVLNNSSRSNRDDIGAVVRMEKSTIFTQTEDVLIWLEKVLEKNSTNRWKWKEWVQRGGGYERYMHQKRNMEKDGNTMKDVNGIKKNHRNIHYYIVSLHTPIKEKKKKKNGLLQNEEIKEDKNIDGNHYVWDSEYAHVWCGMQLHDKILLYQTNLPNTYTTSFHNERVETVVLSFRNAVGINTLYRQEYEEKVREKCNSIWTPERRMCDAISLTNQPCQYTQLQCTEQGNVHGNDITRIRACNCGQTLSSIQDSFDFEKGNSIDFIMSCCTVYDNITSSSEDKDTSMSSYAILAKEEYSHYDPSVGLLQDGFLRSLSRLVPWNIFNSKKMYVGLEYTCSYGHRFLYDPPHSTLENGLHEWPAVDVPLLLPCSACSNNSRRQRSKSPPRTQTSTVSKAQLSRLHLVLPPKKIVSNTTIELNLCVKAHDENDDRKNTTIFQHTTSLVLSDTIYSIRLPYAYRIKDKRVVELTSRVVLKHGAFTLKSL